jgi:hypothetical protein
MVEEIFKTLTSTNNYLIKYEALWCVVNITSFDHFGPLLVDKSKLKILEDLVQITIEKYIGCDMSKFTKEMHEAFK